jgi:hypothetical protein
MSRGRSLVWPLVLSLALFITGCSNEPTGTGSGGASATMVALPSSLIVVAGRTQVIAVGPAGNPVWTYTLPNSDTVVSPPVAALNSATYIRGDKAIYALNAGGKELWQAKHEDPEGKVKGLIALTDSTVAATKGDTQLINYSGSGQPRWTFSVPNGDRITGPISVAASGLLFLRGAQKLYAVDPGGNLSWEADLPQ